MSGSLMARERSGLCAVFGYLSAVESIEHGYFGGYLLISASGLPLEFHCTAPIRPSRAQQILYGPMLAPFLLGEQIGGTLFRKATNKPAIVLTDQAAVLYLRSQIDIPIVRMSSVSSTMGKLNMEPTAAGGESFEIKDFRCHLALGHESDRELTMTLLDELSRQVDLAEPFGRIHEAIREAQRIGRGGQDAHGRAA
jgi:hypothetical protein